MDKSLFPGKVPAVPLPGRLKYLIINWENTNTRSKRLASTSKWKVFLKFLLQEKDFLCKIDFKDAYFSIPFHESSRTFVRFLWSGNLSEFLYPCFGLGRAPRIFTKLLKVPMALLCRINIR